MKSKFWSRTGIQAMTHKCCSSADIGFIEENILENILDKNIGFGERLALEAKKPFKLNLDLCPKQM